jgi:hypothetical protein
MEFFNSQIFTDNRVPNEPPSAQCSIVKNEGLSIESTRKRNDSMDRTSANHVTIIWLRWSFLAKENELYYYLLSIWHQQNLIIKLLY